MSPKVLSLSALQDRIITNLDWISDLCSAAVFHPGAWDGEQRAWVLKVAILFRQPAHVSARFSEVI